MEMVVYGKENCHGEHLASILFGSKVESLLAAYYSHPCITGRELQNTWNIILKRQSAHSLSFENNPSWRHVVVGIQLLMAGPGIRLKNRETVCPLQNTKADGAT